VTSARNYSSIAASAALTSGCSNVDTTIQVDTTSGFPSVPFLLVIDKDRVAEELVLCTAIVGLALTVTRGYDGTSATAHSAAATVKHVVAGVTFRMPGITSATPRCTGTPRTPTPLSFPGSSVSPASMPRGSPRAPDDHLFGWAHLHSGGARLRAAHRQDDPHYRRPRAPSSRSPLPV
jgi:hypothetical protein